MSIEVAGLTPDPLYDPAYRARKRILLELELKVWNDYVKIEKPLTELPFENFL
jgi:hypothetical protein